MMTVSKARLGDYISTLPKPEVLSLNEKILVVLGLISKFNKLETQIATNRNFIQQLKNEKNDLHNQLKKITHELDVDSFDSIIPKIQELKNLEISV